jgi:hypothetical protein
MMRFVSRASVAAALLLVASLASARVISYAPYTNRNAYPAEQSRTNRYFALFELSSPAAGQLVLYDSSGAEEPRVVFPTDGTSALILAAVLREKNGVPSILIAAMPPYSFQTSWYFSGDAGATWKTINLPQATIYGLADGFPDTGGPIGHSRYSPIRIGNDTTPFVVAIPNGNLYGVGADGSLRILATNPKSQSIALAGQNRDGTKFILRSDTNVSIFDLNLGLTPITTVSQYASIEGWITSTDDVYLDLHSLSPFDHRIIRFTGTTGRTLAQNLNPNENLGVFAIPTSDYEGAWIIKRGSGAPTTLYRQSGQFDPVVQWTDVTSPEVEALHAGASGNTLLVQVHRSRAVDSSTRFLDPALAVWHSGDAAPKSYDELFMNEQTNKRFVHLDVDKVGAGDPFVFDSGVQQIAVPVGAPIPSPPDSGGGSDVLQEWGVVRASLAQKLVLPGMARTAGAFNSYWQSDVIIYNPSNDPQKVRIDYIATGDSVSASDAKTTTLTLAAKEIRLVPDALKALFNLDAGGGAFFITPDSGVNVTSRTYTTTANGTYGFGMNGIDFFAAAASPRFPLTFSGAFPGANFRTNVVITDTSGRGTDAEFSGAGILGSIGSSTPHFIAPPNGQVQLNGVAPALGILDSEAGALVVQPSRGTAIASVIAIDNRTNDPTYFPPDLPASIVRTIPALGHLDGANGSKFRSDLYLYNPSTVARTVTLQAKAWDMPESPVTVNFTLLAGEARVIPDALLKLYGKTGIARLRYQSSDFTGGEGVRVTSRTYSVDDDGGTYGFLMPPFNNFQIGTSGDTLEILGVVGGKGFRTNLGLVECNPWPSGQNVQALVEIIDDHGKTIDSFTMNVPSAGGVQINDIFHARGLGDGPTAALIRVSPLSGTIGAYATMNDNGTNDPTYLAANLAAK